MSKIGSSTFRRASTLKSRAQDQLPGPDTTAEIAGCLEKLSFSDASGREGAARILAAAGYANPLTLAFAAKRFFDICRENPWLRERAGIASPEAERILRNLSSSLDKVPNPTHSGSWGHLAVYAYARHTNPLAQCERLRALYFLSVYQILTDSPTQISATNINDLGSRIRKLENRSSIASDAERLRSISDAKTIEALVRGLDLDTTTSKSKFGEIWRRVWRPLLSDARWGPPPGAFIGPPLPPREPPEAEDPGGPRPEPPRYEPPRISPPGEPTTAGFDFAYVNQSLRTRNFSLIKEHVEVATDAEIRLLIAACAADPDPSQRLDASYLLPRLLSILQIATGRVLGSLMDADLGSPLSGEPALGLYLDATTERLYQPIPQPDHIFRPSEANSSQFHEHQEWLILPLPKLATTILRRLARTKADARRPADWLASTEPESLKSPEEQQRSLLNSITGLPVESREPARYRRWATCQIHQTTRDIAATMLICGDELGRSSAPLHYYSPLTSQVVSSYRSAMAPYLELPDEDFERDSPPDVRLGPAALVTDQVAESGISKLSKRLNVNPEKVLESVEKIVRYHNQLVTYLATSICVITTHRPTAALFEMRRGQFDLHRHLAVIADKRSDREHHTRLVATTSALSESLALYFGHLRLLGQSLVSSEDLRSWICGVEQSEKPMFFELSEAGKPLAGSIRSMRDHWPDVWKGLPPNWYRPFINTKLRELGVPALPVFAHMGHLEAAGHPHRDDSIIAPTELLDAVRSPLEKIQKSLGLRMPKGLARTQVHPIPELQDWTSLLEKHTSSARESERRRTLYVRQDILSARKTALSWLERQWKAQCSAWTVAYEVTDPYSSLRHPNLDSGLVAELEAGARKFVDDLLEKNDRDHRRHPFVQIEVHNAISRRLKRLSTLGVACPTAGKIFRAGRSPLSPFPLQLPLASEHVHVMRTHLKVLMKRSAPEQHNPRVIQALTLALFDPFLTPDQIFRQVADGYETYSLSQNPIHLGLSLSPKQAPIGLVGLSALATDSRGKLPATITTPLELDRQLGNLVPSHLVGLKSIGLLERICDTTAAAARIERPGLARHAFSASGAIDASLEQQFAVTTHEAAPEPSISEQKLERVGLEGATRSGRESTPRPPSKQSVTRYHRLLDCLARPGGKAGEDEITRAPKLHEISQAIREKFPAPKPGSPLHVIDTLAAFTHSMSTHGTRAKKAPAVNTIRTYLTTIGRVLLDVFGDIDLRYLQEEDFESAYEIVAESVQKNHSKSRALQQLKEFHELLMKDFGMPSILMPVIGSGLDALKDRPVPRLLSPVHYRAAMQWLDDARESGPSRLDDCLGRRALFAASVALILLRRTGARIGEISLLRLSDIDVLIEEINLTIRPSEFRRLKSAAARRRIKLWNLLDAHERATLLRWLEVERARNGRFRRSLLFPTFGNPKLAIGTDTLRRIVQLAFRIGAKIEMHPHELRHLHVTEQIPNLASSELDRPEDASERQRRAEVFRHQIGHASMTTSVTHYLHRCTPLKQIAAPDEQYGDRWLIAGLSGRKVSNVDQIFQRRAKTESQSIGTRIDWVGVNSTTIALPAQEIAPAVHSPINEYFEPLATPYRHLDLLFRQCANEEELRCAAPGFGYSSWQVDQILNATRNLSESSTKYHLLNGINRDSSVERSVPRRTQPDLEATLLDEPHGTILTNLAQQFTETYRPFYAHDDMFTGDADTLESMRRNLSAIGINATIRTSDRKRRPMDLMLSEGRGSFHRVAWVLAVVAVAGNVESQTCKL